MAISSARGRKTSDLKGASVKGKAGAGKGSASKSKPRATVIKTLTKADAPKNVRQKNIVKVEQLKNKSTLTTLKGGRKIQQVAGKSAYVVAKGAGKPATKRKLPPGQAKMAAASKKKK